MEEIAETFAIFDIGGDGSITTKQLRGALRSLGQNPSEAQLREMTNSVDPEGTGFLDFPSFLAVAAPLVCAGVVADTRGDLLEAFKARDTKSTGFVDAQELTRASVMF